MTELKFHQNVFKVAVIQEPLDETKIHTWIVL